MSEKCANYLARPIFVPDFTILIRRNHHAYLRMSNDRTQPLLSNNDDISDYQALPSGRLRGSNEPERPGNQSLNDIDREYSQSHLVHRRGTGFNVSENPRSHPPGSSQTSVDSQFKDIAAPAR